MFKKFLKSVLVAFTLVALVSCSNQNISNTSDNSNISKTNVEVKRSEATTKLKKYLESDSNLMAMMEKSINKAHEINSDKDTNPVSNIEELYDFIDYNVKALPFKVISSEHHKTIYDKVDQGVDYIWFLFEHHSN